MVFADHAASMGTGPPFYQTPDLRLLQSYAFCKGGDHGRCPPRGLLGGAGRDGFRDKMATPWGLSGQNSGHSPETATIAETDEKLLSA